jgi:hypothetical protein
MGEPATPSRLPRNETELKTPPPLKRKSPIQSKETPQVPRISNCISYTHGTLQERRQALKSSLPEEVPELPIETFIAYLLPKLDFTEEEVTKVCNALQPKVYDPRWEKWPLLGDSGKELKDFAKFGEMQKKIVKAGEKIGGRRKATVEFASDGNKTIGSDWDLPHDTRPDGGTFLKKRKRKCLSHWKNACRADEYKTNDNPKNRYDVSAVQTDALPINLTFWKDIDKVIWSMHYILAQDIGRRFTFGLTIEDRTVRLYFACRSFVAVSKEFDICEVSLRRSRSFHC